MTLSEQDGRAGGQFFYRLSFLLFCLFVQSVCLFVCAECFFCFFICAECLFVCLFVQSGRTTSALELD